MKGSDISSPTQNPYVSSGHSQNIPTSLTSKRSKWFVKDTTPPYGGTRLGRVFPLLWQEAHEQGWFTTNNATSFHVCTPLPWHVDPDQWTSPEHRAVFAALEWAWTQADAGKCRHGVADGPRFVLCLRAILRGQGAGSHTFHTMVGGHDRKRQRAFLDWRGERAVLRSPQHLLAVVAEALDSDAITLRTAGLPNELNLYFDSRPPQWPWADSFHHDLALLGRKDCDICLGLGYTVDTRPSEERVVRPCPDCCARLLDFNVEDTEEDPWPCADDASYERYLALRNRLEAGLLRKKIRAGRKPPEIKITASFADISPEESARRWAVIRDISARVEARQREAETVREEVCRIARPKRDVDTDALVADFLKVAALSGLELQQEEIEVEVLPAPHQRPKQLTSGNQAVIVFCTAWDCLQVGTAGRKTEANYTNQHYSPRAGRGALSHSLLRCDVVQKARLLAGVLSEPSEETIGAWVEEHTARYHFLISDTQPLEVLNLLEAFLRCRLKPVFVY